MKCPKCKNLVEYNTTTCEWCGARLIAGEYSAPQTGYPKAPLAKRFVAALLDGLIVIVPLLLISDSEVEAESGYEFAIIMLFLLSMVYTFIKDGLGKGQSWGKKAVGLMVVHLSDGKPCTKGQSAIRALIFGLLGITFIGWIVEPIMALVTDDGRRLADKTADTQVIEKTALHT
jgi:uncharacterized RDD family membrane protein YckC